MSEKQPDGMRVIFLDGTGITPGSEKCKCDSRCEFPCWQRIGWAPACPTCGCPPFPPDEGTEDG
jgi:hypothetical protein